MQWNLAYVDEPEATLFNEVTNAAYRAELINSLQSQALTSFLGIVSYAAWKHYPTFCVRCLKDNAIDLEQQDFFISRLKTADTLVEVKDLPSDHVPFASMPADLAKYVKELTKRLHSRKEHAVL